MASTILEQAKVFLRIKNSYAKFEEAGLMTVSDCKARMKHLERVWSTYDQNNMMIIASKDYPALQDQPYIKDDHFTQVEEYYLQNMSKFQTFLDEYPTTTNPIDQPPTRPHIVTLENERLPPLNIPHFSGDYTAWESFRDMFVSSVIKRKNYSNVAKFHQLISVLEGDAAKIAASYQPTDANFQVVWDKLKERYEVKKRLVHAHIANLYSLKPVSKSSASELKKILSGVTTPLSALKSLGRPVGSWDDILVFHILNLLDTDTRRQWEIYYSAHCNNLPNPVNESGQDGTISSKAINEPPSLQRLIDFIENQVSILESIEEASGSNTNKQFFDPSKNKNYNSSNNSAKVLNTNVNSHAKQNSNSRNNPNECVICNSNHFFLFCNEYKNKTPKQREEIVLKNKRCFNCLGTHFIADCKSTKRCNTCKQKHHTTLHIKGYKKNPKNNNNETLNTANNTNKDGASVDAQVLSTSS